MPTTYPVTVTEEQRRELKAFLNTSLRVSIQVTIQNHLPIDTMEGFYVLEEELKSLCHDKFLWDLDSDASYKFHALGLTYDFKLEPVFAPIRHFNPSDFHTPYDDFR